MHICTSPQRLERGSHQTFAPRVCCADIDFYRDSPGCLPPTKRIPVRVTRSGQIHAVLCTWEVFADRDRTVTMSTDPEVCRDNFPRDMQWGQGLQLLEDRGDGVGVPSNPRPSGGASAGGAADTPKPFMVEAGEWFDLVVIFSSDSMLMQFLLERRSEPPPGAAGAGDGDGAAADES